MNSGDGLWTTFGARVVTLTATIQLAEQKLVVHKTVNANAWYAMSEGAREATRMALREDLARAIVRKLNPEIVVDLPKD